MNQHLSDSDRRWDDYRTSQGMAAELIRVQAQVAMLLGSVGAHPGHKELPSEALARYVKLRSIQMKEEEFSLSQVMEITTAAAKMFNMFS